MKNTGNIVEMPRLGEGIYFTIDVANILHLPYHRVKYMMKNFWHGYSFGGKRNQAVNFFALIEFYTYYQLRESGYSPQQIRRFHDDLSNNLKLKYPFASITVLKPKVSKSKDETQEKGLKKRTKKGIWYQHDGNIIRNDRFLQPSIEQFVRPFLKQIEFGDNLLAKKFYPLEKSREVVVDPLHQFGQPVISGTNLQTQTIYNLFDAGETKNNISKLYDIPESKVTAAIRFHRRKAA